MLVTSCPDCRTTFRISVGILEKAGGQVRCGRCAKIFDANTKLREVEASDVEAATGPKFKFEFAPDTAAIELATADSTAAEDDDALPVSPDRGTNSPAAAGTGAARLSPAETDAELEAADAKAAVARFESAYADFLPGLDEPPPRRNRLWVAGACILTITLAAQAVHYYRASLVDTPVMGPAIQFVYSSLGREIYPSVDLGQYNLLDLTAVADNADDTEDWLVIETRVHNAGPKVQPYPYIFVRLLDRWGDTIAGRYFSAHEYAVTQINDFSRMNIDGRVDAQFVIMDPGPSATGFELELCTRNERGYVCESDIAN